MRNRLLHSFAAFGVTAASALSVAQAVSAVTYDDARRFIEADAEARCCNPRGRLR